MELAELDLVGLNKLLVDVQHEIVLRRNQQKADLLKKLNELAKASGMTLEELIPASARSKRYKPRAKQSTPKYQNPKNPAQTWTGFGRKPNWFIALLNEGKREEELLIS